MSGATAYVLLFASWPAAVLVSPGIAWLVALYRLYEVRDVTPESLADVCSRRTGKADPAAVTSPSGVVLVFDRHGHPIDELSGPHATVKDLVIHEMAPAGKFFTIEASSTPEMWTGTGDYGSSQRLPREVTLRAFESHSADWAGRALAGHPAGQATWVPEVPNGTPGPADIWLVIRDAALAS